MTRAEGRTTYHCFSFGTHYDPGNTGVGEIRALNDERLPPGTGYATHRHRETDIVTIVLAGTLRHASDAGEAVLGPGDVQLLRAGTGVEHAETNPGEEPTRFLQTWLAPREAGVRPTYERWPGALGPGLERVHLGDALPAMHLGTLTAGASALLPPKAQRRHVFFASGYGTVADAEVGEGDAVRLHDDREVTLTARTDLTVLVWSVRNR